MIKNLAIMPNQDFLTNYFLTKFNLLKNKSEVYKRHKILNKLYKNNPALAMITDSSKATGININDPFRTSVSINEKMQIPFKVGIHEAVGGDHDYPNPGDLLCASLAACFDNTIRMISNRIGIELKETRIKVTAKVDVRGTLMIDKSVPVNFQSMHVEIVLISNNISNKILTTLIRATKRSCIIYQTIKKGIPITSKVNFQTTL